MITFCEGSPNCSHCDKPHRKGFVQNCEGGISLEIAMRKGWGTWLASLISKLGIKKGSSCGCQKREAKLNKFGWWVSSLLRRCINKLYNPKCRRRRALMKELRNAHSPIQEILDRQTAKDMRRAFLLAAQNKP